MNKECVRVARKMERLCDRLKYGEALELGTRMLKAAREQVAIMHPQVAILLCAQARALRGLGRMTEAERRRQMAEKLLAFNPSIDKLMYAEAWTAVALAYREESQVAEAERCFLKAGKVLRGFLQAGHDAVVWLIRLASRPILEVNTEGYAELVAQRTGKFVERLFGTSLLGVDAFFSLAAAHDSDGQMDIALKLNGMAAALVKKEAGENHPYMIPMLGQKADLLINRQEWLSAIDCVETQSYIAGLNPTPDWEFIVGKKEKALELSVQAGDLLRQECGLMEVLRFMTKWKGEQAGETFERCLWVVNFLMSRQKFLDAETFLRHALKHSEKDPDKTGFHPLFLSLLGNALRLRGEFEESEKTLRQAIEADRRNHRRGLASRVSMPDILRSLADIHRATDRNAGAIRLYQTALTLCHGKAWNSTKADLLRELGEVNLLCDRLTAAEPAFRQALALLKKLKKVNTADDASEHSSIWHNLGVIAHRQKKAAKARELYAKALAINRKAFGVQHPKLVTTLDSLADLEWKDGHLDEAERNYGLEKHILEKAGLTETEDFCDLLNDMGVLLGKREKYKDGIALLRQAIAIREQVFGPDSPDLFKPLRNLGNMLARKSTMANVPFITCGIKTRISRWKSARAKTAPSTRNN